MQSHDDGPLPLHRPLTEGPGLCSRFPEASAFPLGVMWRGGKVFLPPSKIQKSIISFRYKTPPGVLRYNFRYKVLTNETSAIPARQTLHTQTASKRTHTHTHTHTTATHTHAHTHRHKHTRPTLPYACTHTCARVHTYTQTRMQTRTHTYTRIHT